ncbi:MAG: hypothetical protein WC631_02810 [Candidatus Paceibacterota bacterium]|jgi:hypothetical protein
MPKFKRTLLYTLFSLGILTVVVIAGSLTPSPAVTPGPTSYTLSDLYNLIQNNTTATLGDHVLSTTTEVIATTSHSIGELYVLLANLVDPINLADGITKLGATAGEAKPSSLSASSSSLAPLTSPDVTGYSLEDIWNLTQGSGIRVTSSSHTLTTGSVVGATMHSISQIYSALTNLFSASDIKTGTTYLAVAGSYVPLAGVGEACTQGTDCQSGLCSSSDYICLLTTQITNCTELQAINTDLLANYILTNDIDCSDTVSWNGGSGFEPIGTYASPFAGIFSGDYYKITNLYINRPGVNGVGLFGYVGGATITKVGIENVDITGQHDTGSLVGGVISNSTLSLVYATGVSRGGNTTGGLLGYLGTNSTLDQAYFSGDVYGGTNSTQGIFVGGLIGDVGGSSILISNSYSTGTAHNNGTGPVQTGGLIGCMYPGESFTLLNSYSTSVVSTDISAEGCGGLVGHHFQTIQNSFATGAINCSGSIGGISNYDATITNTYWYDNIGDGATNCYSGGDTGCTKINDDNGGLSYFYSSLNAPMNAWNFTDTWLEVSGDFPHLRFEGSMR